MLQVEVVLRGLADYGAGPVTVTSALQRETIAVTACDTSRRNVTGNWQCVFMTFGVSSKPNELRYVGVNVLWQLLSLLCLANCWPYLGCTK